MALRLRVVSDQRRQLGARGSIVFGVGGGSIGRSADNDWVLPDPHRYISGRHARIHFRQGGYYLEDTSTNGIYVNDAERPLPKHEPYELRNGDLLRFGEYHVLVSIDQATDFPLEASAVMAVEVSAPAAAGPRAPAGDIGASLNLQSLLAVESTDLRAVNAYGQAVGASFSGPVPIEREASEDSIARRLARLAHASQVPRERANGPAIYDVAAGLQAFCRGAGIDADSLPAEAHTRMLQLAGQLFRETLLGLKDLGRTQHEQRNRFRIETPRDPEDTRPSSERTPVDELLVQLLSSQETRRVDAVQWLREEFAALKGHQSAAAHAMRAAFVEFVKRLDPGELEGRFERAARGGKARNGKDANWALYAEFYRSFTEMPPDHLPHLFVEAFANAYRESVRRTD